MNRLTEMDLLQGEHEEITSMDFRKRPGDRLAQVQMGKTYTITSYGKPVAVLSKPNPSPVILGAEIRRLGLQGRDEGNSMSDIPTALVPLVEKWGADRVEETAMFIVEKAKDHLGLLVNIEPTAERVEAVLEAIYGEYE